MNVTGGTVYPYIHHSRFDEDKPKTDESTEPQLKCTWHCCCVALKALSGGIVLIIVGSLMTAAGIMAEENLIDAASKFPNGTLSDPQDVETLATYRNLSFAGPVLLGLGGVVVLAALILTFEARDTLGVKVAPTKVTLLTAPKSDIHVISSALLPSEPSSSSKAKMSSESLSLPLSTFLTDSIGESVGGSTKPGFSKDRLQETIMETNLSEASAFGNGSGESPGSGDRRSRSPAKEAKVRIGFQAEKELLTMSRESHQNKTISCLFDFHSPPDISRTGSSHLLSPTDTIDHYFDLPSPQETELSDPEGCSLELPSSWKSARCSCSTSPNSLSLLALDLFLSQNVPSQNDDHSDHHPTAPRQENSLQHHQLQQKLLAQQQLLNEQHQQQLALQQRLLQEQQDRIRREVRGTKTIASVESDGLSSSSSGGGGGEGEGRRDDEDFDSFSRDSSFKRSKTRQATSSSSSAASGSTVVNYRSRSVRSGAHISFTTI